LKWLDLPHGIPQKEAWFNYSENWVTGAHAGSSLEKVTWSRCWERAG
jgi:hypothetical protein